MDQRGRWGLTPGMATFVVVDVILVVTFVILAALLQPFGPRGPVQVAGSTSGTVAPETTPDVSVPADPTNPNTFTAFELPSHNIWCEMTETSATCTILRFTFTPPDPPTGCSGTVGNVLRIVAGHDPQMECVVGAPPPVPAGAPTLEYGQASTVGQMTCHSSTNGVTCRHNPTGQGFSVARAGYRFF
ncbi:hypothetical protein Q6348_08580 [Isoptericola sp. b441]|uniref:Uncharacterized protein n=1 Tax=Actinotalea lenta TaxID=3064654 RepID=A0ABT9D8M8_9CELL|nr:MULTISPECIES: hypothetical protein [unclassified Isoptericola]MDO8107249.1 hypothetical protein [Isoptericola sp. b441]MDO8121088.1 hypothetical protein [Isoptericola sp. b490]